MAQDRSDSKDFSYATVTIDLAGNVFAANIANDLYRCLDPWEDLRRKVDLQSGRTARPVLHGAPVEVFDRLRKGVWQPEDVTSVITLGLIGAGQDVETAARNVDKHVRAHPIVQSIPAALLILGMYLIGVGAEEDD